MRIYLVRHGEAAPGDPDSLRPLTAAGREQARRIGERLATSPPAVSAVRCSPLLRARETALLIAEPLGIVPEPDERLAPGADADDVLASVAGRGDVVVVVGHQPDCGRIAAALVGGPEPAFPAGAMVELDV